MLLFQLAHAGGVLTILSPCILPVPPFVFAHSDQPFVRSGLPLLLGMAITFAGVATLAAVGGGRTIWRAFHNDYWPAHYLIDGQGHIRRDHDGEGEGEYDVSEAVIRQLLREAGHRAGGGPVSVAADGAQAFAFTFG